MIAFLNRSFGRAMDPLLCASLALLHRRHAERISPRDVAEKYFAECERQTRAQHFVLPRALEDLRRDSPQTISWHSRALSVAKFPANARARVTLFQVQPAAPTVVMLHALMSVSDT